MILCNYLIIAGKAESACGAIFKIFTKDDCPIFGWDSGLCWRSLEHFYQQRAAQNSRDDCPSQTNEGYCDDNIDSFLSIVRYLSWDIAKGRIALAVARRASLIFFSDGR